MPASIVINQTGKPAGTPSQSREDLALGVLVTLTNSTVETTYLWELLSKPVGSSAVLAGTALPVSTFTPDVAGSYRIKLTTNSSDTDIRIAAVKTANLGIRKPATDEGTEFNATDGWGAALQIMIDTLDSEGGTNLKADGSNSPSADVNWDGNRIVNLGSIRLTEGADPTASTNAGSLYTKDADGYTELFYRDNFGKVTPITDDGYLFGISFTLHASKTIDFGAPATVPGSVTDTIVVQGAAFGDRILVAAPVAVPDEFILTAHVSAPNIVTIKWTQVEGAAANPDGAGGLYKIDVIKD